MDLDKIKDWHPDMDKEVNKNYFISLAKFVDETRLHAKVYPSDQDVFRGFDLCSFTETRVVIIGQDPYHGPGQANGLAFSVNPGVKLPPSLKNIFKEIQHEGIDSQLIFGDLSPWAEQGVLLLNRVLTVEEAKPGSHLNKGWEIFTDKIIELLSKEKKGLIFLLWGSKSRSLKSKILNQESHHILESNHPSPLSANRGGWFGNQHFIRVNEILQGREEQKITW